MSRSGADAIDARPERRQTLAVTAAVAVAYLPLAALLAWQVSAFFALILVLRLAALRWPGAAPGRLTLLVLTLAGMLNCLLVNHSLVGKYGGTALLVTMLGLKLLELRERRDHRIVAIVLALLVVVQFLFSQGPVLTLFLGALMVTAVALLVDLNGGLGPAPLRETARVTALLTAHALPLTVILFLLFPRLAAPLWDIGLDAETGLTGLGDTMEPGSIIELVVNGELAFRTRFQRPPPAPDQLYWRGLVLWDVDDRRWTQGGGTAGAAAAAPLEAADDFIDYEVLLEPTGQRWLPALDLPVEYPPDARLAGAFQLTAAEPAAGTRRYQARSALRYRTADATTAERRAALRLPPTVTARQRALAARWASGAASDWDLVQAGLAYFNQEDFRYTLLPPRLGANVWDEFLFETRAGFCEHFAGSFAVMMRLAGIPARVVLGYLGGEPNRIGGHYMIWQSDAHAWVEVLIAGRGWVRVDPTTAIAASRIDRQGAARLLGGEAPARFHLDRQGVLGRALRQLRDLSDSLGSAWQTWVLDFSTEQQFSLLERLGLRSYGQFALVAVMLGATSLVTGLILLALLRQAQPLDPCTRTYARFCRRLASVGLERAPSEGPCDFAARVAVARPDLAPAVGRITALYVRDRFSPGPAPGDRERLEPAVRRFHPTRRPRRRSR